MTITACANNPQITSSTKTILKDDFEWTPFLDSSRCFKFNTIDVDSLVLYYIDPSAPEVINKPKFVIWKNGNEVKSQDFTNFVSYANRFAFFDHLSKNITLTQLDFEKELIMNTKVIFQVKESCENVESLKVELSNKTLNVEMVLFNDCESKSRSLELKDLWTNN